METTAYLCLGSNIEPRKNLAIAVNSIQSNFQHCSVSSVYQTPAQGFEGQDFLNLAIKLTTQMTLAELLSYTDQLEQAAGRVRVQRGNFDSRTLDVDVVMYGDLVGTYEGRVWPAADLRDYGHVLKPLAEIAQHSKDPFTGNTFEQLWDQFEGKREFEKASQTFEREWLYVKD